MAIIEDAQVLETGRELGGSPECAYKQKICACARFSFNPVEQLAEKSLSHDQCSRPAHNHVLLALTQEAK